MRVRFAGVERRGPAVDLRDLGVAATDVVDAVRDPDDDRVAAATPRKCGGRLQDAAPGVHERVGFLHPGLSVAPVAAVAAAARSRGARTEHDEALRRVDAELASMDVPDVDLAAARECVADTAADVDRLRERVARAGGRVEARRDDAGDAAEADAEAALASATRELAERETDYHAAREALAAARRRAREARDARERRLELEDRRGNLRRAARRELADAHAGSFRRAVAALPVPGEPAHPADFAGPDWTTGCAVARLARPGPPLVVADALGDETPAGDGFDTASRARAALDAPVLLVEV